MEVLTVPVGCVRRMQRAEGRGVAGAEGRETRGDMGSSPKANFVTSIGMYD